MNLITLRCEGDRAFLGKHQLKLPAMSGNPSSVLFGIRPEDISFADDESKATTIGRVYLVEQLGKDNLVSLKLDDSEVTMRALLSGDTQWQDRTIPLAIDPSKIHLFDIQTGDRLN